MDELIARLEAATKGDRGLDLDIAKICLGLVLIHTIRGIQVTNPKQPSGFSWDLKDYTTSLDAALTLVPDGANCWGIDSCPKGVDAYWSRNNVTSGHWLIEARHPKSAALALCIAALKARAQYEPTRKDGAA